MGIDGISWLRSNSPAKGEPECRDVPMLPVRYALTSENKPPMDEYGAFKWSGGANKWYKGTLRTINTGWVHIWSAISFPEGKSIKVSNNTFEGAEWLRLPLADPCVRIAYSHTPWSPETWKKVINSRKLFERMQQVIPRKMAKAKKAQGSAGAFLNGETHSAPIQLLNKVVEEYREKPGFLYGLEELPKVPGATLTTREIFDPDLIHMAVHDEEAVQKRWQYSDVKLQWNPNSNLPEKMTSAVCVEYNPFFTALHDPIGVAMDFSSVHSGYCGMQDMYLDWHSHATSSAMAAVQLWKDNVLSEFMSYQKGTIGERVAHIFIKRAPCAEKFLERRFAANKNIGTIYFKCVLEPWMKHMQIDDGCSFSLVFDCDFSDTKKEDADNKERLFASSIRGITAHTPGVLLVQRDLLPKRGKASKTPLGKVLLKVAESAPLTDINDNTESWLLSISNVLMLPDKNGKLPKSHRELLEALDKRKLGPNKMMDLPTAARKGESSVFYARNLADSLESYLYGNTNKESLGDIHNKGISFSPNGTLRPTASNGHPLLRLTSQNNGVMLARQYVLRSSIQGFAENFLPGDGFGEPLLTVPLSTLDEMQIPAVYSFKGWFWPFSLAIRANALVKGDGEAAEHVKAGVMICCQGATTILAKKIMKTAASASVTNILSKLDTLKPLSISWRNIISARGLGVLASIVGSGISLSLAYEGFKEADNNSYLENLGYAVTFVGGLVLLFAGPAYFVFGVGSRLLAAGKWISLTGMALAMLGQKRPIHRWLESSYWGVGSQALSIEGAKNKDIYETYRMHDPLNLASSFMEYRFPKFSLKDNRHMYRTTEEIQFEESELNDLLRITLEITADIKYERDKSAKRFVPHITFKATQAVPWQSKLQIDKTGVRMVMIPSTFTELSKFVYRKISDETAEWIAKLDKEGIKEYLPTFFDDGEWITFQDKDGFACWRCYLNDFETIIPEDMREGFDHYLVIPLTFTYSEQSSITLHTELLVHHNHIRWLYPDPRKR